MSRKEGLPGGGPLRAGRLGSRHATLPLRLRRPRPRLPPTCALGSEDVSLHRSELPAFSFPNILFHYSAKFF